MTVEQRKQIETWVDDILIDVPVELNRIRSSITILDNAITTIKEISDNDSDSEFLRSIKELGRCRLLIGILMLDLTTSLKIHLNAKHEYESLFSVRQIIVIIKEGFQQIYHYNINGRVKKSYWILYFDKLINKDLPLLKQEYEKLTKLLENYLEEHLIDDDIKKKRDLSVHYDANAEIVYDMISSLNINNLVTKLVPFIKIVDSLFDFTNTMIQQYCLKSQIKTEETNEGIDKQIQELEGLRVKFSNTSNQEHNSVIQDLITKAQDFAKEIRDKS